MMCVYVFVSNKKKRKKDHKFLRERRRRGYMERFEGKKCKEKWYDYFIFSKNKQIYKIGIKKSNKNLKNGYKNYVTLNKYHSLVHLYSYI